MNYEQRLREINLKLLEPYKGAKVHHSIGCLTCDHVFIATPISKLQNFKRTNAKGCPLCARHREISKAELSRAKNKQLLKDKGLTVHTPWTGQRVADKYNTQIVLEVTQEKCGHTFTASAINLICTPMTCSVCGRKERTAAVTAWSKANSAAKAPTREPFARYRAKVQSITNRNYKQYKNQINPMGLPFGRCGDTNTYQLDHIVPVRWCFEHYVPVELAASVANLQILTWQDNLKFKNKLKGELPDDFKRYAHFSG